MNLLPYIYAQASKSSTTGIPLMRMMFMEYPDDNKTLELWDQYFFGDDLLVAPIVHEGAVSREVYLPDGKWIDLFTNKEWKGKGTVTVQAPIDKIPVFMKKGSILPLNLSNKLCLCSHVGNKTNIYQKLCFIIYPENQMLHQFEDELGNKLSIGCLVEKNKVILRVHINQLTEPSAAIILRGEYSVTGINKNGRQCSVTATEQGNPIIEFSSDETDLEFEIYSEQ